MEALIIMIFMVYADKILMNIIIIESAFKRNLKFRYCQIVQLFENVLLVEGYFTRFT
jgi:hypothetical protein